MKEKIILENKKSKIKQWQILRKLTPEKRFKAARILEAWAKDLIKASKKSRQFNPKKTS